MINNHIGTISESSSLYETEAWGLTEQGSFINQAHICHTSLSPDQVLESIVIIESKMGRKRERKWGPRIIDIDIIYYGQKIIKNPHLYIPHPELSRRRFVLVPLMDICPDLIHPELDKSTRQLLSECSDNLSVKKIITKPEHD